MLSYVSFCVMSNYQNDLEDKPTNKELGDKWIQVKKVRGNNPRWRLDIDTVTVGPWPGMKFKPEAESEIRQLLMQVQYYLVSIGYKSKIKKRWNKQLSDAEFIEAIKEFKLSIAIFEAEFTTEASAYYVRRCFLDNSERWMVTRW